MKTIIAVAALVAGLSIGTANAAETTECTTYTSTPVHLSAPDRWSYTYKVSWCVSNGEITSITPLVTHDADGTPCTWEASAEEAYTPVRDGSGAWHAFNMGQFSCTDGIANPWAVIALWPSGASSVVHKGIGDLIVE